VLPIESVTEDISFVEPPLEELSAEMQSTALAPATKFEAGDSVKDVALVL
jgi:hypothetical protein